MAARQSPVEMFNELVQKGYIIPASVEPSGSMIPTAYITVPTATVFSTPVAPPTAEKKVRANAELGPRAKRNTKRNKRRK
jgi:hypothetical protein